MINTFFTAFLVSCIVTLLIIKFSHIHIHLSADSDFLSIQKFHTSLVPRVGGISVFLGILCGLLFSSAISVNSISQSFYLLCASVPAFLIGFLEDLTKRVGVKWRLLATCLSAIIAGLLLELWLSHIDFWIIDYFLGFSFISIVITCFAVSGLANAFNLIDGYNGLSAMVAVIILSGLAYISFVVGDHMLLSISLVLIGAILGFLIWNYPFGLIFLGDGGAYLIGFFVAELSILLVARNPSVSPWCILLMVLYPVFETLFTICRRFWRGHQISQPDAAHLHQLVYRFIVRRAVGNQSAKKNIMRNSFTSVYLWALTLCSVIPAVIFWDTPLMLKIMSLVFIVFYILIYYSIIRKKVPKWMMIRERK